jgi:DNA-binding NarL/FixJ family response regulator
LDVNPERLTRKSPRIVLADDNHAVLEEVRQLLAPEFQIVGALHEAGSLVDAVRDLKPDAVVSDINMPGMNGIAIGRTLIHSGWCDAVVILTVYNEAHMIQGALRAGIRGYVLKVDAGGELAAALRAVIAGYRYLSRGALATWTKDQNRFTGDHPPQKAT